jgi:lambda family phage tail tape measure protein
MAFSTLAIDLTAKVAGFEEGMSKAVKSLDRVDKRAAAMSSSLKAAFGAVSVGALASFAKSGIDAADALNDMSQKLGVSVKDLASMKLAAEQSGTSLDDVGAGMARLTKSIGLAEAGNKQLAQALRDLGITARDPREAFFQLADAVKRIEDPSKRAALLSQVLGKSYGDLVPLLGQGSEALRASAAASESFADAMARLAPEADKFNDQLALLKQNAAGASAAILGPLVSSFNEYIAVMQEVIKTGSILDKIRFFGLGNASDEIVGKVRNAAKASADAAAAARKAAAGSATINLPPATTAKVRTARAAAPKLDDIDPFYRERTAALKAAADQVAETERMIAEHLQETNDVLYQQAQAWTEAGRALEDEMRTPLENANIEFARLDDLLARGAITWETYSRAVFKTQESLDGTAETLKEMDTFAKEAAEGIQNAFTDFLSDPFADGLDGMLQGFGQMIQKMIAEAVAADLARRLFGDLVKGGSGSGLAGGFLSSIGGMLGLANGGIVGSGGISAYSGSVVNSPTLFPFASGIGLMGEAGAEAILPLKRGRDGKLGVSSGGGPTINVYVSGNNAPDVRRAAGQGAREALGIMNGATRYA